MSNNFWQTNRHNNLYSNGQNATQKVKDYQKIWKERCYKEIPEELPPALAKTNRAPSWKSIALALLNNDLNLYTIGFAKTENKVSHELMRQKKERESNQKTLF